MRLGSYYVYKRVVRCTTSQRVPFGQKSIQNVTTASLHLYIYILIPFARFSFFSKALYYLINQLWMYMMPQSTL